jgi:hypothetical protein
MSLFKNKFAYLLEKDEEEIAPPQEVPAGSNPLDGELDQGVSPEDLGAGVDPEQDIASIKQQSLESQKAELTTWVQKIEEFVEFLNGVNDSSVSAKLHAASCDTMFDKIASSEHKKVSRVAVDLSALAEAFKGYLIAGDQ